MSWTAGMINPFVVKGDTIRSEREYIVKASETFKKGELIRITNDGEIALALTTTSAVGGLHGIAAANATDYLTDGDYAGQTIPVLLFTTDTVIGIQLMAAKDQDDVLIGESYATAVASNKWTMTVTPTNGIVQVVGKPANDQWFDTNVASDEDRAPIYVKVIQSVLDGRSD